MYVNSPSRRTRFRTYMFMNKTMNNNMTCRVSCDPRQGDFKRFTPGERDTLCKVGPHDIKRSPTYPS